MSKEAGTNGNQDTGDKLSASDFEWYAHHMEQIKQAEITAFTLRQSVTNFLAKKYRLNQGDNINDSGIIERQNKGVI